MFQKKLKAKAFKVFKVKVRIKTNFIVYEKWFSHIDTYLSLKYMIILIYMIILSLVSIWLY